MDEFCRKLNMMTNDSEQTVVLLDAIYSIANTQTNIVNDYTPFCDLLWYDYRIYLKFRYFLGAIYAQF